MAKNLFTLTVKTTTPADSELLVGGTGSANAYNFTWTKAKEWMANFGTNVLASAGMAINSSAPIITLTGSTSAHQIFGSDDAASYSIIDTSFPNPNRFMCFNSGSSASSICFWNRNHGSGSGFGMGNDDIFKILTNGVLRMTVNASGTVDVVGTFTAGTKTFIIDHPLESMNDTHKLRHSSVESPKADLIYRGKVQLINGKAKINIDESSDMTEGTFEVLCRDIQCFTTNETGWDLIKGSINGNILTIQSKTVSSIDTISWMVIGERKDEKYIGSEITDDSGKFITEPLKEVKKDVK